MEATSLDNAVEAMLAPAPSEENQSEAVEAAEEPTQDVESETVEDVAEGDDDVEASGEDIEDAEYVEDDQIDDDDLVEAAEDTNLIPVKINGKEEHWTLDQLKQSAAGQGYINQKMQENAALEKKYKEQTQALAQQQQQVLALYQQAQQGGLQAPTPPSKELFDQDPIGYMEAKLQYDEAKAAHDQQVSPVAGNASTASAATASGQTSLPCRASGGVEAVYPRNRRSRQRRKAEGGHHRHRRPLRLHAGGDGWRV